MPQVLHYKHITEVDQLQQIVNLQKEIWGDGVISSVPQLVAAIHNGGSVIGVLNDNQVIGFCYGFPGFENINERPYLVSHMMGVTNGYRNQRLGEILKFKQREWALKKGYEKIIWTFDPLEIKNGYLNLTKLGGMVGKYIKSYYGNMDDRINKGIPSDRLLLEWNLQSSVVIEASKGSKNSHPHWSNYPLYYAYSSVGKVSIPDQKYCTDVKNEVLIPIPKNVQQIKAENPTIALQWRMKVRESMTHLFSEQYIIIGVLIDEHMGYYVLEKRRDNYENTTMG
ncbi:GNAT family N-acetyltransferase [Fredinandcohnia onubensis]|uniref:GNAT family N-acetyltransferase n=1 Tax=Fredinandcohnia onubensis TaxID=1571209 RepID=UPI000C0BCD6F|nr:GNAT family N-acetyltransferase [Fredinandcohnia onubensis]